MLPALHEGLLFVGSVCVTLGCELRTAAAHHTTAGLVAIRPVDTVLPLLCPPSSTFPVLVSTAPVLLTRAHQKHSPAR